MLYTRMGWIVPLVWLGTLTLASQVPAAAVTELGLGLSQVTFIFLAAAALSALVLLLAEAVLNRHKVPTTIRPLGREREVMWGTHTLNMLPIGFYAVIIPVFTVIFAVVFSLM